MADEKTTAEESKTPKHPFVPQGTDPVGDAVRRTREFHTDLAAKVQVACQGTDDDAIRTAWMAYTREVGKVDDRILEKYRQADRAGLIAAIDAVHFPEKAKGPDVVLSFVPEGPKPVLPVLPGFIQPAIHATAAPKPAPVKPAAAPEAAPEAAGGEKTPAEG